MTTGTLVCLIVALTFPAYTLLRRLRRDDEEGEEED